MIGRHTGIVRRACVAVGRGEHDQAGYAEGALGAMACHTLAGAVDAMLGHFTLIERRGCVFREANLSPSSLRRNERFGSD